MSAEPSRAKGSESWRPIEMAPQDGSEVDVWVPGEGREIEAFYAQGNWWVDDPCEGFVRLHPQPSHWMPLPEPPRTQHETARHP